MIVPVGLDPPDNVAVSFTVVDPAAPVPVVSGAVLIYALAESFPPFCPPQNCPALPNSTAPIVTGIWLVVGILVLVYFNLSKREKWIGTAGAALGESEDDLSMARVTPAGATSKV